MYLFLGSDTVVPEDSVVAVFDLENSSTAKDTRDFLARAQKEGRVVNVTDELPKSFAVCAEGADQKVYVLQVASATLKKRAGVIDIK